MTSALINTHPHIEHNNIIYYQLIGHPEYYLSMCGKVLSLKYNKVREKHIGEQKTQRYKSFQVRTNGKVKVYKLHRILCEMFIPNPNNYDEVDHINRDTHDNNLSNLRWADRSMNMCNRGEWTTKKRAD